MADIFGTLGGVLEQQFSLGDNKLRSLDIKQNGHTEAYGLLGEFAQKFDHSAERSYTEEGWSKTDLFNPHPKQLEIWMQQPEATVLVKKRAFSSLVENYRSDMLDKDEKVFLKASKILFQNKCNQISAYERLTKLNAVVLDAGKVDTYLLPVLLSATDTLDSVFNLFGSSAFSKFKSTVDRVRTIINLSKDTIYTSWITNVLNTFKTGVGEGTGVIEFTTATSISTTTSVHFGGGSFNMSFSDPYHLMRITSNDIEQAIADATNLFVAAPIVQLGLKSLNDAIAGDQKDLNKMRARRGANPIRFLVNPDTFLGKRIRAIIDNSGIEILFDGSVLKSTVDPAYRVAGIAAEDGLSGPEESLFNAIIRSMYNALQLNKNTQTVAAKNNVENNKLRKKMMLHYGGKLIIQPMDNVHIFVSSKTQVDNKILGGLQDSFNGAGLLQATNTALMNLNDFFSAGQDNSIEKSLIVGNDFPNWLWLMFRNQFSTDKSGTQIFAGLVDQSSYNYDSGSFTVNVSGGDNSSYFNFGVVNYKPALDVWNGSLYDPITPFDIKFDKATGLPAGKVPELLPENTQLFKSAFVKYKNGIYVGKKPNFNNYNQDSERIQNTAIRKVFYDPDGMVYKWKEGIGALVMFGNNYQENSDTNTSVPPITADPFAGQDVMNVLSLLVTGEPYNFATFYKAASSFNGAGRDPATGLDPSTSYFQNLQTDIKKRNLLYGNFVPFKKLTMDAETYKRVLNNQIRASSFDAELSDLLDQKSQLDDKINYLTNFGEAVGVDAANLQTQVNKINTQISDKMSQIDRELNQSDKPISVVGNDITLDYPGSDTDKNDLSGIFNSNKAMRRRTHELTRRLSWKVRANEDLNFFIVDDTYDKDYDIQAFEKSFTNPSLFRSDYSNVAEKIRTVKELLDLEVFADSQGHIQVRPPQYNKIPSSVFYRMLNMKSQFGIQVYPQFLEDLYINQLDNVLSRVEVLEDEIRMYGLALAKSSDSEIQDFLASQTVNIRANNFSTPFSFISNEDTGDVSRILLKQIMQQDDPVFGSALFSNALSPFDSIKTQSTINGLFSVSNRVDVLKELTSSKIPASARLSDPATKTRQDKINGRLSNKTGSTFDLAQLFPGSEKLDGFISSSDLLKILNELAQRIAERQRILKVAAAALKNAQEGASVLTQNSSGNIELSISGLLGNRNLPPSMDGLIEDENYDDYGPGSGDRYVIKNAFIKRLSITEKAPPFTSVEVHGKFADNFSVNLPQDLDGFQQGGNALTTAVAVDYDLWRMYGNRIPQSISAPYLTDPQTQCAPFAVAVLNKARKEVQSGTVVIFGNEYMQPGEVVYLENEDMLFYTESVNHSFVYGREFSTTLNISYGHMPGQYIPTYLDTVGKVLYRSKDVTNIVSVRQDNVNNEQHIGTIVGNTGGSFGASSDIMSGTYGARNRQTLENILQAAETAFSVSNANYQPILELRIFSAPNSGFGTSSTASGMADAVKNFLVGTDNMLEQAKTGTAKNYLVNFKQYINVVAVNSNDIAEFRTPSSAAYSAARELVSTSPLGQGFGSSSTAIDSAINKYVVDCWIYFKKSTG